MSDVAIRVMGLGKEYQIGARASRHRTLRESLMQVFDRPFRRLQHYGESPVEGNPTDKIWALKDVSFDVKQGEVVGVIGRNGAGKSTLLKILSRITEPTKGRVEIRGRVGALLEVGTGFHSELTGRENIYLNGAILGMRRAEIARKFDEIVAFAEVEKFIDTPVKHYSSGMYMRLAFAVAAHLELEILLVDEVLAVGDAAFQRKCMGKMEDVAREEGRTVLFVSHNMGVVQRLCGRALLVQSGGLQQDGMPEKVIGDYLTDTCCLGNGGFDLSRHPARASRFDPIIQHVVLRSAGGAPKAFFYPDDDLQVELTLAPLASIRDPRVAVAIEDCLGRRIMTLASYFQVEHLPSIDELCRISCTVPKLNLGSGRYLLSVSIGTRYAGLLDSVDGAIWFEVGWRDNYGNGEPYAPVYGPVLARSVWKRID